MELSDHQEWAVDGIVRRKIAYLRGPHSDYLVNSVRYWDVRLNVARDCSKTAFRAWVRKTGATVSPNTL